MKTEILYEDSDVLVIYKPAGFAAQTAVVGQADVVSELKNHIASSGVRPPYLGIIHRLDQPVEGLLVFAKNKKAAAALTGQLSGQEAGDTLHKRYYAVIYGNPSRREGELVNYMYRDAGGTGKAIIAGDGGENFHSGKGAHPPRKAVLQYKILQTVQAPSGDDISLADIRIETGRFHQIRAQLAHARMAILGDGKYGDEAAADCSRKLGIREAALCAYSLSFVHPTTGKRQDFQITPRSKAFEYFRQKGTILVY